MKLMIGSLAAYSKSWNFIACANHRAVFSQLGSRMISSTSITSGGSAAYKVFSSGVSDFSPTSNSPR